MQRGPFGETVGSRGPVDMLGPAAQKYRNRAVASRSPKRLKVQGQQLNFKVSSVILYRVYM